MSEPELIIARRGRAGRITLNRPGALNALTHSMIKGMTRALTDWRDDPELQCAVVDGAGDRAFCAGADIRALHALGKSGDIDAAARFFRDEYALNHLIRTFPKPYVALMDGVTMGGGVGVSVHGAHRIATERTLWAMPETGIGLFPDVGMTHVLPRLLGHAGTWLGLTGARLDGTGALALGLATDFVPSDRLPDLIPALEADGPEALGRFREDAPPHALPPRGQIESAFGAPSVAAIMEALAADPSNGPSPPEGGFDRASWAQAQLRPLQSASPTSLAITFEALRRGAALSFEDCLRMELRLAVRCLETHDFHEGVRAQIVDKDRDPHWRPAALADVSEAEIASYFAVPPPGGDLELAPPS